MKWIATILLQLTIVCSSFAQDITNEGTDFWFGYTEVYDKTTAIYEVTISSRTSASGTVLVQGAGFSQNFNVLPGTSERIILPAATVNNEINGALALKAIHIVSDNPVVVFASTVHLHRTEVSVVLPTPALGSEYLVSGKAQVASTDQSEFVVVAAGDSCRVQITTTADCGPGGSVASAGVPFEITIDSGEVFQVQTTAIGSNLAGSEIIAVNGTDVFAVYSGNVFINIEATYNKDPLFEVEYPVSSWGREYIVPRVHGVSYSAYQVIAKENATEIFVNGSITPNATIDRGESYEDTMRNHEVIVASKPVKVMHYLPSSSLTSPGTSGVGDPAMAGIGPNKHMFLDTVTFYQHEGWLLDSHFVNIVTRSLDTNSVQLDGSTLSGWESLGAMPEYSTKTVKTDTGAYTLTTSGCGFFVYSYGYRWAESYYYSAGVLLNTSEDSIIASNLTSSGSNCANDSILFEATTGYGAPVSYSWYFGDGDSSSLDSPTHQYSNPGSYQVSVIINYSCISDTIVYSIHMLSCGITALSDTTL